MSELKMEEIKPGMFVRIFQRTPSFIKSKGAGKKEGDKEKTQKIEGLVIARKHGKEIGATVTIRRVVDGIGVEWILPVFSPEIKKVELINAARVKRAKLGFLREKSQKQIRAKLKKSAK